MMLYIAGMQNIDRSLYEAAEIDGANAWQRFRLVTLPRPRADDPPLGILLAPRLAAGLRHHPRPDLDGGPLEHHAHDGFVPLHFRRRRACASASARRSASSSSSSASLSPSATSGCSCAMTDLAAPISHPIVTDADRSGKPFRDPFAGSTGCWCCCWSPGSSSSRCSRPPSAASSPSASSASTPFGLPHEWVWYNYWDILTGGEYWQFLGNSLCIAGLTVFLTLVVSATGGLRLRASALLRRPISVQLPAPRPDLSRLRPRSCRCSSRSATSACSTPIGASSCRRSLSASRSASFSCATPSASCPANWSSPP